jgi:hypothetical protein
MSSASGARFARPADEKLDHLITRSGVHPLNGSAMAEAAQAQR